MSTDTLQFYPTGFFLASKMHSKFKDKICYRSVVLEPQAGRGDLITLLGSNVRTIDCIELDFDNAAILRDKGFKVIGHNFLDFVGHKHYSHIISNPPFNEGEHHALKAWEILHSGEMVILLNAQTIKNPNTAARKQLAKILEDNNADIEYVAEAFQSPDTKRKTSVECAIVHVIKERKIHTEYGFLKDLKLDVEQKKHTDTEPAAAVTQQLALPSSTIKDAVISFNAAKRAMLQEIEITNALKSQTSYYTSRLSESIIDNGEPVRESISAGDVSKDFNEELDKLQERAWSTVFTATDMGKKLSSAVLKDIQHRFEEIKALQFTESNIHGFLLGLASQQGDMQINMLCDVHDTFTKYHPENRIFFKGWKSNNKHRDPAFRVKNTRMIMPLRSRFDWFDSYSNDCQAIKDIDKAFRMLDGKPVVDAICKTTGKAINPIQGIFECLEANYNTMSSERYETEYFDIRHYKQAGTLHMYPRRKDLVDQLNAEVGKHRQWIPETATKEENTAFWQQHDAAEAITKIVEKDSEYKRASNWDIFNSESDLYANRVQDAIDRAGTELGFNMQFDRLPATNNDKRITKG